MEQTVTTYRHFYSFKQGRVTDFLYVDIRVMEKFGFWLTENMEYTAGSNCKFWIPSSQLKHIEKVSLNHLPETEEA